MYLKTGKAKKTGVYQGQTSINKFNKKKRKKIIIVIVISVIRKFLQFISLLD